MRGILDEETLDGTNEVRISYRPERMAVPLAAPLTQRTFISTVRDECQIWGGAVAPLVPLSSDGFVDEAYLALALLHDPELLLLDEPYAGFDWETYLRFWEMAEQRRQGGMGILVISHLLAERQRLTRVYELCDGRSEVA